MYLKKIKKKFFILIKILFQFLGLEVKKINLVDLKMSGSLKFRRDSKLMFWNKLLWKSISLYLEIEK